MLPEAEAWAENEVNLKGPLAGIPVSLKDSIAVKGFDVSVGYSCNTGSPYAGDGTLVRILKAAGAIPYVKTNLPTTLLSFESSNDVWGRCLNPHNSKYSPGGSTGGEAALLAYGGGRIGIGSDVAGSVRAPAHFSGIYSLRCSTGRWPKMGMTTSMPGQEGIPSVFSPMTRTLEDLVYFSRSLIGIKPWKWDHSVHPIEWRNEVEDEVKNTTKFRIGVMRTDGNFNQFILQHLTSDILKALWTLLQLAPALLSVPSLLFVVKAMNCLTLNLPPRILLFELHPSS